MIGASEFGPDFQRVLVMSALRDLGLRALVARFVNQGHLGFTDPTSAWAWRVVSSHDKPTALVLEVESHRLTGSDPARVGLGALFAAPDIRNVEYVRGQIVEWARETVFSVAMHAAAKAWNAGDSREAMRIMAAQTAEAQQIRLDHADRGWFFEEFDQRQLARWQTEGTGDAFPIGITRIDRAMGGGLRPGDLEVPMAYSGVGKTFWCVQRGFVGARMRRNVLHFVLEGGRRKTADRYEARWAHELYTNVRAGNFDPEAVERIRREYAALRGCLVIRGFADKRQWHITYEDILEELDTLRQAHGWVPELIVVDYGDVVHAPGSDEKERQKAAFKQLAALAERQEFRGHLGYAVSAPSQAQRPGKGRDEVEHVLKPHEIADAYDKVRVATAIVSINRTNEEKRHRRARVFLGKYRDEEDGACVRVRTDYAHGAFCELGLELDSSGNEVPELLEAPPDEEAQSA